MTVMNTVNEGYQMTKKSWFSQAVYTIVFSVIFSLIMIPFAFLVAIGAFLRGDLIDQTTQLNITTFSELLDDIVAHPVFWFSIYLLVLVAIIFFSMALGMVQFIGIKKFKNEPLNLEDSIKYPFTNGRFLPFLLLGFLESILVGILGVLMYIVRDFLDLNTTTTVTSLNDVINNFLTWQNIVYLILTVVVYLIVIPPYIISCLSIIEDKSRYNAFALGWKGYVKSFLYFEGVTIVSLIPVGVVAILVALIGVGISTITGFETTVTASSLTTTEFALMLTLSFVIILLGFLMIVFLLPFFYNSMGESFEEQKAKM